METDLNKRLTKIINRLDKGLVISKKDIADILGDTTYVAICGFTNCYGSLTDFGVQEIIKEYAEEIAEELHAYKHWNCREK